MIIKHIVTQHAEEAAFLWTQRADAVVAPHYGLSDLAALEERIEAHLDGLRVAAQLGWEESVARLDEPEAGEIFVAALLALEAFDEDRLSLVIAVVDRLPDTLAGLVGAVGWLEHSLLQRWIPILLAAQHPRYRYIGVAAASIHQLDIGSSLAEVLADDNTQVKARALRAVGVLKRRDLAQTLRAQWQAESTDLRFWACWSSLLLGDTSACEVMMKLFSDAAQYRSRALLALALMDQSSSQDWLRKTAQDEDQLRWVMQGIGMVKDASYIPTLVRMIEQPALARIAGEAFSLITGVDLTSAPFAKEEPEGVADGPSDEPEDEQVALDHDDDLPWPEVASVQRWWADNHTQFTAGTRYLLGQPISEAQCMQVLRVGTQRQRAMAAYELAWLQPDVPMFEVRALAKRQVALLQN